MPTITAITLQKRRSGRYSIFVDNEFFLGLDEEVLYHAKLKEGQEIDPKDLKDLVVREEYSRARQYVLNLLSRRLYTNHEVRTKLTQKGYESFIIEKLITDLESKKLLNDSQFAQSWIEDRIAHRPRGPAILRQELLRKGIARELITELLKSLQSTDDQIILAEKALLKKKAYCKESDPRVRKRKIYQYLAQKGFSPSVIQEIVRNSLGKIEQEEIEE
jgi:regulatory protein